MPDLGARMFAIGHWDFTAPISNVFRFSVCDAEHDVHSQLRTTWSLRIVFISTVLGICCEFRFPRYVF